ncbi:hypothetical protein L3X38_029091 [Prunus dulcis]|uniref:Reverse transcriptase Ty1/copia-type domain-containing protein n=1 Tax=Prunus dulcis TaxID=3755 RepID=A0AAD4Z234_PRUDU|nr:hypothetical protein L3X38_029091 [Prunus dulcis]
MVPTVLHNSREVYHLRKALHGLKQVPCAWFEKFSDVIGSLGFRSSAHDPALFVRSTSVGHILLLLYGDDMILTGDDLNGITQLKLALNDQFEMKDLGPLCYFLGIEVPSSPKGYLFSQSSMPLTFFKKLVLQILEWLIRLFSSMCVILRLMFVSSPTTFHWGCCDLYFPLTSRDVVSKLIASFHLNFGASSLF